MYTPVERVLQSINYFTGSEQINKSIVEEINELPSI